LTTLEIIDLALLVITENSWGKYEDDLVRKFRFYDVPFIIIHNKSDLLEPTSGFAEKIKINTGNTLIEFSAVDKRNYENLISLIKETIPEHSYRTPTLLGI
jgi:GTPase Era involved in 16S rRNA processing